VISWPSERKGVESSTVLQLQSENRQGSAIVNAVSVRTGCRGAIVIPTIEVGNKESVNGCVAESVILNKCHKTRYNILKYTIFWEHVVANSGLAV
jgi:hypothetical protein